MTNPSVGTHESVTAACGATDADTGQPLRISGQVPEARIKGRVRSDPCSSASSRGAQRAISMWYADEKIEKIHNLAQINELTSIILIHLIGLVGQSVTRGAQTVQPPGIRTFHLEPRSQRCFCRTWRQEPSKGCGFLEPSKATLRVAVLARYGRGQRVASEVEF